MPFPSIDLHGPRYRLRAIDEADLPAVFAGLSDPQVIEHYGVSYDTLEETRAQLRWYERIQHEETGQWWCICAPEAPGVLLGACGVNDIVREHRRAELGYWLLPPYWRRGIAFEAVDTMIRYAFAHLGLHRLGADVDMENKASAGLLHKLGFVREGVRRGYEFKQGAPLDLQVFSRLSTDR